MSYHIILYVPAYNQNHLVCWLRLLNRRSYWCNVTSFGKRKCLFGEIGAVKNLVTQPKYQISIQSVMRWDISKMNELSTGNEYVPFYDTMKASNYYASIWKYFPFHLMNWSWSFIRNRCKHHGGQDHLYVIYNIINGNSSSLITCL